MLIITPNIALANNKDVQIRRMMLRALIK